MARSGGGQGLVSRAGRADTATGRQALSKPIIVAAAIEIIAERGVEGLSMRHLSERLGVALGATYKHVPDKHTLLRLVAEVLYARIEPADDVVDEFEQAKSVMLQVHEVLAAHPGMAEYIAQHVPEFSSVNVAKLITGPLCAGGLSPAEANRITLALVLLNGGHMLMRMPVELQQEAADAFEDGVDLIVRGARARVGQRSAWTGRFSPPEPRGSASAADP
jgi:AcrR family transcriptional regulator